MWSTISMVERTTIVQNARIMMIRIHGQVMNRRRNGTATSFSTHRPSEDRVAKSEGTARSVALLNLHPHSLTVQSGAGSLQIKATAQRNAATPTARRARIGQRRAVRLILIVFLRAATHTALLAVMPHGHSSTSFLPPRPAMAWNRPGRCRVESPRKAQWKSKLHKDACPARGTRVVTALSCLLRLRAPAKQARTKTPQRTLRVSLLIRVQTKTRRFIFIGVCVGDTGSCAMGGCR